MILALLPLAICALFNSCFSSANVNLKSVSKRHTVDVMTKTASGSRAFHIMRSEQLREIPKGASIGVLSSSGGTLSLFLEADLESKGLLVRQIDISNLLSAHQKEMTDPAADFAFATNLVASLQSTNKDAAVALSDKLLAVDDLTIEKQLSDHYLDLYQNVRRMVDSFNVDYLVIVGQPYQEKSYAFRIYDSKKLDLIFSNLFVGDDSEWRSVVGKPKNSDNLSSRFDEKEEPKAYWEMAYSKFVTEKIKIGSPANAAIMGSKP